MERYKLEIVNDNGDRYIRCEPAPDGSWVMFKDVAELQSKGCARDQTTTQYCAEVIERDKRIAELEAALATAQRDAMEEAARKVEIMWLMFREKDNGASDWIFRAHDDIPTGDDFVAAIRALGGGKS